MSEMNQVLQAVLELSNKVDEKFEALSGKIDGLESRMESLEGRMDSLEGRMQSLEGRMDSLEGRMQSLEGKMDSLEEQSKKNNQMMLDKLDSINEQITILAHDAITTKGDVRLLKKKIGMLDY